MVSGVKKQLVERLTMCREHGGCGPCPECRNATLEITHDEKKYRGAHRGVVQAHESRECEVRIFKRNHPRESGHDASARAVGQRPERPGERWRRSRV